MADHPLKPIQTLDPKLFDLMEQNRQLALGDGVIPRKYKFLIAMALDAAAGASNGVTSLSQAAMKAGATREEVAEALRVASYIAGAGAVYTAASGLKDIV